jgi:hypothetical protein
MPRLDKATNIIEKIETRNGEITINLKLDITIDGNNNVRISTPTEQELEEKKPVFIPEEDFEVNIPTIDFGQKMQIK